MVDDEKNIRDRLTHFLPWSEVGFEVVGAAENGREALELIKKEQPHAVLTDVMMMEMTGLELAKEIKTSYPEIKVVILSAYDDFKYAQEAIHYGVKGYLLKPLMKNDFYDAFGKMAEELREDAELQKVNHFYEKWNTEELMLLDLIKGENLPNYADHWNQQTQSFKVAIFSFDQLFKETSTFSIRQRITELAADFWNRYQVPILFYGNSLILLLTDSAYFSKQALLPNIQKFVDSLQEELGDVFKDKKNFVVGVGDKACTYADINRSYNEAVYAYSYKYFNEYETVIFYEDVSDNNEKGNNKQIPNFMMDHVNKIESLLLSKRKTNEIAEVSEFVTHFFDSLKQVSGLQIAETRGSCSELIIILLFRFKEKELSLPSIDHQQVLGKIYEIDSLKELKRWLTQMLETMSFDLSKSEEKDNNRYVLMAKEYVKEHYQERITLEDISNHLFLHLAYFSAIFKKETGENFIDYVNKVRVEEAANLLRKTDYKIKVISDMTGFQSHSYFNKVFKNETGMTPVVFRRQQKR
ncbi:two component AraC family transcriptional regulator [Neobacillus bataviensis LMG 21833]|uniref:Two component AraC family transcriptional regulator n=1 Tax=Neobacillus bataviensis LMG 21833 TaxID=1117379 RepID=K6C219_9BACI|nr:two component AraC family transcriptional regulator [Neobacillus bataviensis LMG 21833]